MSRVNGKEIKRVKSVGLTMTKKNKEKLLRDLEDAKKKLDDILDERRVEEGDDEVYGALRKRVRELEGRVDEIYHVVTGDNGEGDPDFDRISDFRNRLMNMGELYGRLGMASYQLDRISGCWNKGGLMDFIPKREMDELKRMHDRIEELMSEMDGRMSVALVERE